MQGESVLLIQKQSTLNSIVVSPSLIATTICNEDLGDTDAPISSK